MADHRVDLRPDKRGFGKTMMLFNGKAIGVSNSPIYAAARWLLANNASAEDDTTYRGETLSMHGKVGDLAKLTAEENKHGNPSLRLARWKAFSSEDVAPRTGETAETGMGVAL